MRSHRAFALVAPAVALLLLLGARQGEAQGSSNYMAVKGMDERFRLDVGGFFQKFETTVRIDSTTTGLGTEVNLEDDLGLSSDQVNFRADGYWRFGRHGRLDFAYLGWNRQANHKIDRDITIGDTVYHAGATLDSRLKVSFAELYYGYSFWNTPEFEAGLQLGLTALFNKTQFEGTGTVSGGGGSTGGSFASEDRSLTAPVPAIGAQLRYTLLPGFLATARIRGSGATIDNVKASSLQWRAGLDYYPWKNVGFGAAYDYMDITVEKQADRTVKLDYKYSGPMVYLSLVF
jgi:opacity protein-like surface antigen